MKVVDSEPVSDRNFKGMFSVAQAVAEEMTKTGGSIINIASVLVLR